MVLCSQLLRLFVLLSCVFSLVGCARLGFNSVFSECDGGSCFDADTDSPAFESIVLTLHTESVLPERFNPRVEKEGALLTWDLGDGSEPVNANEVDHVYDRDGEKVVTVVSTDGVEGITLVHSLNTNLVGPIPGAVSSLINLEQLNLAYNDLSGEIPADLGNLTNLTLLTLSFNNFSGNIPAELGNLTRLTALYIQINELEGSIPPELGNLIQLASLVLGQNNLSGSIPTELGNLIQLTRLGINACQLSGAIPAEIGNLVRLREFDLADNQLSGAEPGAIGGLQAIENLGLAGNGMSQAEVDAIINEIYEARESYNNEIEKILGIGNSNAAPGAEAMSQIDELQTSYLWTINCTGC